MSDVNQELTLAPMDVGDLDQVLDIERASFPTPWTRAAFCYEIQQNKVAHCTAIKARRGVVGYLCFWEIGHEIHVTNLAVHPEWRRRGVARCHHFYGAHQRFNSPETKTFLSVLFF